MKGGYNVLLLILFVSSLHAQTFLNPASWTNADVSLGTQAILKWQDDAVNKNVIFRIEKSAAGYIAVGLGSSMADADILVIERNTAGNTITLKNCKLKGQATPVCTETGQDFSLVAANSFSMGANFLTVEFKRSYNGTLADGDKPFLNGANTLIWAYTTSDTLVKHDATGGKGTVSVTLNLPSQTTPTTNNTTNPTNNSTGNSTGNTTGNGSNNSTGNGTNNSTGNGSGNGTKVSSSKLQICLLMMPLILSILAIAF